MRHTADRAPRDALHDREHHDITAGCGSRIWRRDVESIRLEDEVGGLFSGGVLGDGTTDLVRRTVITGTVVREQPLLSCSECGAPTQTPAHREFIRDRLPDHMAALLDRELCQNCARDRGDRPRTGPAVLSAAVLARRKEESNAAH